MVNIHYLLNIKRIAPFLLFALFLLSCEEKDMDLNADCYPIKSNPLFSEEKFKKNYSIELPEDYTGQGYYVSPFLIPTFERFSPEGVHLFYQYVCPTDCAIYFGPRIDSPPPEEICYHHTCNDTLNQKIEFCNSNEHSMILYYSSTGFDRAKLYMKDEGVFKEALKIELNGQGIESVIGVLSTIKRTE